MVLLAVTFVTLDNRQNSFVAGIRSTARELFNPVGKLARGAFRPVENTWDGIRDYSRLKRDFEELQDQVGAYEGTSIAAEAQIRDYEELLATNGQIPCSAWPRSLAQVVGRPATNYDLQVEINIGSKLGIATGMPVFTPYGLVGRIGQVSESRSFVRLLYDPNINVGVNIIAPPSRIAPTTTTTTTTIAVIPDTTLAEEDPLTSTTTSSTTTTTTTTTTIAPLPVPVEHGNLRGQGPDQPLKVEWLSSRGGDKVRVGDNVRTAGDDQSLFPGCIPVGKVTGVETRKGSSQLDVTVEPSANLDRLNFVWVMVYLPGEPSTAGGS